MVLILIFNFDFEKYFRLLKGLCRLSCNDLIRIFFFEENPSESTKQFPGEMKCFRINLNGFLILQLLSYLVPSGVNPYLTCGQTNPIIWMSPLSFYGEIGIRHIFSVSFFSLILL